jgi:threonine dehydrogenase-like Zn-dependent dehydrogenase
MAISIVRAGGIIGYVGVPLGVESLDLRRLYARNVGLRGGVAPVRTYMDELLVDVVAQRLDPSPVFDLVVDLDDVAAGYEAMDTRASIKVVVRP